MTKEDKQAKLSEIAGKVNACRKCALCKLATKGVPGEGDPEAKIMFIGEGPGFHEDQQGRPFVGQAGKLLDKLIETLSLKRGDVFIANVVKHRPPENRDPLPEEIAACSEYLDEQIDTIGPKVIVTLGRFSMAKFIPEARISAIHGQARFADFNGKKITVVAMYHPAAALRSGQVMNEIKKDFLKLKEFLTTFEILSEIVENESNEAEEKKEEIEQMPLI